jgi:hypothetical protein
MFQRWQRIILAALMITVPLAAGAATDHDQHTAAAKAHKSPAKPGAKAAKPVAKTASRPQSHPGSMIPDHGPPTPPPASRHSHFDIPQAKNLAETPDVVLNTRVRAALMAALSARNQEEITPQTTKGVVTLTGSVKSKALRARAEQAARKVHGVRAVKNQLAVK